MYSSPDLEANKLLYDLVIIVDQDGNGDTDDIREALDLANVLGLAGSTPLVYLTPGDHPNDNTTVNGGAQLIEGNVTLSGDESSVTKVTQATVDEPGFQMDSNVTVRNIYFQGLLVFPLTDPQNYTFQRLTNSGNSRGNSAIINCSFEYGIAVDIVWGNVKFTNCTAFGITAMAEGNHFGSQNVSSVTFVSCNLGSEGVYRTGTHDTGKFVNVVVVNCQVTQTFNASAMFSVSGTDTIKSSYTTYDGNTANPVYYMEDTTTLQEKGCSMLRVVSVPSLETVGTGVTVTSDGSSYWAGTSFTLGKEADRPATYFDIGKGQWVVRDDSKAYVRIDTWKWNNIFRGR